MRSFPLLFFKICRSTFVNSTWIRHLYEYGSRADGRSQLDRPLLSKYFQIIGRVCSESRSIVDRGIFGFNATTLTSSLILSREAFHSRIALLIRQLIRQMPCRFGNALKLMARLIAINTYPSAFNTDWLVEYGDASNDFAIRNLPRLFDNGTCNCVSNETCQEPLRVGPPGLTLPGLVIGCLPLYSIRTSTLECFHSSNCTNTILRYLDYYTSVDGSPPVNFTPPDQLPLSMTPLDLSAASRFSPNESIGVLMNELLLEQWQNVSSYEAYYDACAPNFCRYEYVTDKDGLFVVTSLLGLYGGLIVGLRFFVWHTLRLRYWIQHRSRVHQTRVATPLSIAAK